MAAGEVDGKSYEPPIDRTNRSGSIGLVVIVALALVVAMLAVPFLAAEWAERYLWGLLAILAVVGVFALLASAAGILRFADGRERNDVTKAIVDRGFEGMVVTDPSGRIAYANQAYLDLIGATRPEDVRTVERAFDGDPEVAEAIYRLAQSARDGKKLGEDVRVPGKPGQAARWYRIRVRPLDPERRAGATVWTAADITRDREGQETIFQELQHAIDYLDHAPAGFFSVDATGRVVYLNATLAGWLDHDLAQIGPAGLKLSELVAGDGAKLIETLSPTPGDIALHVVDLDLRTKNGRAFPVRLLHKIAYTNDGTPGASRTLVLNRDSDGTDALRSAEVRFARFFNSTPIAIAAIDAAGRLGRSNAAFARVFGDALHATDQKETARSLLALIAERDRPALAEALAAVMARKESIPPVEATLAGDGSRSARFFLSAVEDSDGDSESAIVYALDITEAKHLERQFAQSQKMNAVGQLAGGIAHDFNNVLNAIILASDFLLGNHRPTDPSFSDIMQIKQNANRAAALVRQLLAFSRRQTLRPQVIALGDAISDLSMLLRRLLGEKVKLDVIHGRDLWPVRADLSQFEQVVVNLAVNARDAMPSGGTLTIRTRNIEAAESSAYAEQGMPAGDYVLTEVQDTGTGMTPEVMEKIYEPFFSTKEVGKGTGLGLATVYGVVKQTGGWIFCDSVVGRGTTFRIYLPRDVGQQAEDDLPAIEAPVPAASAATGPTPVRDLTGQGTILLVEDEEGLRALNARALASRGFKVIEAGTGVEALAAMDEIGWEVDLVVSDVVMPEMDGPTLLGELRKKKPEMKIIFVSGYAEDAFKKNLPDGEVFGFLPKPFALKQLIAAVKEAIG